MPALELILLTRPGCHLCDDAKAVMQPVLKEFGATLREVDVDSDEALRAEHGLDIPVVLLGSRKLAKHRVDLEQLRRQLREASREAG